MPRPLIDSPFIFGVHEPGGERHMLAANRPGWVLFSEALGHNPDDLSGVDYTGYSERGLGVIACLNHGYEPDGTIPHNSQYEQFARRVANFVGISRGCKTWVIGNEMNYAISRPGIKVDWSRHTSQRSGAPDEADPMRRGLAVRFTALPDHSREIRTTRGAMISPGEVITPELYVRCYRLCRDAIHRLPGHEDDLVLVGAVAPWNTQTIYPGNPNGDWVQYFQDILTLLGPGNCDGLTLHACTHGADASLIASGARLGSPFQNRHLQFRVYMDFLMAVPPAMRALPAFLTEAGQDQPWLDRNTGWVQAMYAEIDGWNRQTGNQQIRAAILYRWPRIDRWYIDGKLGVEEDFRQALLHEYRWRGGEPAVAEVVPPPEPIGEAPEPVVEAAPMPVATVVEPKRRGRRARQQISEQPYQIEWIGDHFPARLTVGQVIVAPITLKNTGTKTWSWGGGNPFRLGYRYYRNRRPLAVPDGMDLRTDVPEDVPPGQTIIIQARIALPTAPGNYTLELDLVQEGVTWFKDQGSPVLTRWLTVEAADLDDEAGGRSVAVQLPVRLFTDISGRLPRSGTPYARRDLNQIRYIVISHTGAHSQLSLERIALAHIKRGYPGIAYDFVVDSAGHILKVTDLEDVAQPDQVWSEQGVNVCLTGNFNAAAPPLAQLDGAGRLCAWLAQNLGMAADAIVGLGDLIRTDSPGETFYKGPRWKEVLTRQVKLHLAVLGMAAGDSDRLREIDSVVDDLRSKNLELGREIEQAQTIERQLRQTNESLQAEVTELRQRVDAQPTVVEGGLRLRMMADKLPRDSRRYVPRTAEGIEFIVINHTSAPPETSLREIALAHRSRVAWDPVRFCHRRQGRDLPDTAVGSGCRHGGALCAPRRQHRVRG